MSSSAKAMSSSSDGDVLIDEGDVLVDVVVVLIDVVCQSGVFVLRLDREEANVHQEDHSPKLLHQSLYPYLELGRRLPMSALRAEHHLADFPRPASLAEFDAAGCFLRQPLLDRQRESRL